MDLAASTTAPALAESLPAGSLSAGSAGGGPQPIVLQLEGADKRYPGVHALRGVDLEVRRGEVHAIVGENGAGKSTLVGIAAGSVVADSGTIRINGRQTETPSPQWSRSQGLAIVHQEPALLPDLTVAENMRLGVPESIRPAASEQTAWAVKHLEPWREVARIDPREYVRNLAPDQRFIVEIARALSGEPNVLILDEPTEHLLPEGVQVLFQEIRRELERGGAVVYISHRIHEVASIADRISVLRDGICRGTFNAAEISEDEIVKLIVGRRLDARFPVKARPDDLGEDILKVQGLSGSRFRDVEMTVRRGEIVGLAGIDGGQHETMRALAGLESARGDVRVNGKRVRLGRPSAARARGLAYLPSDRHSEGMFPELSVRENLTIRVLPDVATAGVVRTAGERRAAESAVAQSRIKTASLEENIEHLSGGNQQKVVLGRLMLANAPVIMADEPTQGVDVGARSEIYRILRDATGQGSCVLVTSSDAAELAGLCDRVLVFSRGQIVAELAGDGVTEDAITTAALTARTEGRRRAEPSAGQNPVRRLFEHDLAPSLVLVGALAALAIVATVHDSAYFTTQNFGLMLPFFAALALLAIGQQIVIYLGGIDLSVGPLAGLLVVVASFVLSPTQTAMGLAGGWLLLVGVAVAVGLLNWALIAVVRISPLIATLATFMGIQGVTLLVRDVPGGSFAPDIVNAVESRIGFVPVAAIVAVAIGLALEFALYRSLFGLRLRGVGSRAITAAKLGISKGRVELLAYLGCSLFTLAAAVLLMPQIGSGDPTAGTSYTLLSVSAVVLGGASLFGGRGSFVGAVLGAALIVQIDTVVQFLGLTNYWQQYLLGGLTIVAVAVYSRLRRTAVR